MSAAAGWTRAVPRYGTFSGVSCGAFDVGRIRPGSAYAQRFPRQQAVDGARIPRLADLFELVQASGNEGVRLNIETKISPVRPVETAAPGVFVRALLEAIGQSRMESRVFVQSFDWRTLASYERKPRHIPTVYLRAERSCPYNIEARTGSPWTAGFHVSRFGGSVPKMVKAAGGAAWSPDMADLTLEALEEAQALGLKVIVWTVNAEADIRRLMEWGVDGIISDYPDLLCRLGVARGPGCNGALQ